MGIITIFIIAFALGIDSFSVCIGVGMCGISKRKIYTTSLLVAFFHVVMPLLGMFIGHLVGDYIGELAEVFGALVLFIIGAYYLISYLKDLLSKKKISCMSADQSLLDKPFGALILAISVSIDALAVGFGLGALGMDVILTVLIMGGVTGCMTYAGLILGRKLGRSFGDHAELLGAILLIGIGIYFLLY